MFVLVPTLLLTPTVPNVAVQFVLSFVVAADVAVSGCCASCSVRLGELWLFSKVRSVSIHSNQSRALMHGIRASCRSWLPVCLASDDTC